MKLGILDTVKISFFPTFEQVNFCLSSFEIVYYREKFTVLR